MKTLWSTIFAIVASAVLASPATAQIQSWDKQLGGTRFKVLRQFNDEAVLDQETGLVWERQPSTVKARWSPYGFDQFPATAHIQCDVKVVGKRLGWRLPTIQELASLADPAQSRPPLPGGHPFSLTPDQNIGQFWSATTSATDPLTSPNSAWTLDFYSVSVSEGVVYTTKSIANYYWCVRSGSGVELQ